MLLVHRGFEQQNSLAWMSLHKTIDVVEQNNIKLHHIYTLAQARPNHWILLFNPPVNEQQLLTAKNGCGVGGWMCVHLSQQRNELIWSPICNGSDQYWSAGRKTDELAVQIDIQRTERCDRQIWVIGAARVLNLPSLPTHKQSRRRIPSPKFLFQ